MAKLFVDVRTPGNGKAYEFQLDSNMSVRQVKAKIIDEITEIENGNITLHQAKAILCNLNTRLILNDSATLWAGGVRSGHSLLLV